MTRDKVKAECEGEGEYVLSSALHTCRRRVICTGPNSVSDGIPNDDASYECFLLVGSVVQGGGVEE